MTKLILLIAGWADRPYSRRAILAGMATLLFIGVVAIPIAAQEGEDDPPPPALKLPKDDSDKNSEIHGRVIRADNGKPVRRAQVLVFDDRARASVVLRTATDQRGEFVFRKLGSGKFYFVAYAAGLVSSYDRSDDIVSLDGKNTAEVSLSLNRGAAISGRARYADNEPVVRQQMVLFRQQAEDVSEFPMASWFTNDKGEFRITELPPGTYLVGLAETRRRRPNYRDQMRDPRTGLAAVYYPSALSLKEASVISVGAGDEASDINITLMQDDLFSISGKVKWTISDQLLKDISVVVTRIGEPPPAYSSGRLWGLFVASRFDDGLNLSSLSGMLNETNHFRATTDESGAWTIGDLPPGKYSLQFKASLQRPPAHGGTTANSLPDELEIYFPTYVTKQVEVEVAESDVTGLVVELGRGSTISGVVADEGTPAADTVVAVSALAVDSPAPVEIGSISKPDRTFQLKGVGSGTVLVDAGISTSTGRYVRSMMLSGVDLLREPLRVAENADINGVQIQLGSDLATLTGKITNSEGEVLPGAYVLLATIDRSRWGRSSAFRMIKCNGSGEFSVGLPPGQYLALTLFMNPEYGGTTVDFMARYADRARMITLQSNERKQIELPLILNTPQ